MRNVLKCRNGTGVVVSTTPIQGITLAKDVKLRAELYSIQEILSRGFV